MTSPTTAELSYERLHDVRLWRDLAGELRLSPRELDVAILLVLGCSAGQIAKRLGIAKGTVLTYITRIKTKAGASHRAELIVRLLLHSGLLLGK